MARKWWTLTAVVGVFMVLLDVTIVNVALPDIQQGFHASLTDLHWVITAYALTLAAGLVTAGSLADRHELVRGRSMLDLSLLRKPTFAASESPASRAATVEASSVRTGVLKGEKT